MDRLLDALANDERRTIVEYLLGHDEALAPPTIREGMKVPSKRRAHFGRQITELYLAGVLERFGDDAYVIADRDLVDRLLQQLANAQAALDARRAELSQQAAKNRVHEGTRRRTAAADQNA